MVFAVGQMVMVKIPATDGANPVTPVMWTAEVQLIESLVVSPVQVPVTVEDSLADEMALVGIAIATREQVVIVVAADVLHVGQEIAGVAPPLETIGAVPLTDVTEPVALACVVQFESQLVAELGSTQTVQKVFAGTGRLAALVLPLKIVQVVGVIVSACVELLA